MIKRHFFLVGAIAILALMVVAGVFKLATGKSESAGGGAASASPGGGGGGGGGAGGGGGQGGRRRGGPVMVSVVTAQPKVFVESLEVLGVAKGRQSVTLTAAATQLVQRVLFTDGQRVSKGAVLVELRATEQSAELGQARARLVQAERAYERYRKLGEQGFASKAAIDQYQADYLAARADVAAAEARASDHLIRAPFSGVVGLSDIAPGALVNPGATIVTLDDLSAIRVDFQVPERFIGQLREGQVLTAHADAFADEPITGRVAKLDTRVDERTRAVTARAEFPNPAGRLKPGMMIRVSIAQGERRGLAIPESALQVFGESSFVFAVTQQGDRVLTDQRPVVVGLRQDGMVEIRDGLTADQRIVADGLNKVQPGQPVQIAGARGAAAGGAKPRS